MFLRSEAVSSGSASGPVKHNHENPLFFDLLPAARPEMSAGWLPPDQQMSSEGLPEGWSMQVSRGLSPHSYVVTIKCYPDFVFPDLLDFWVV